MALFNLICIVFFALFFDNANSYYANNVRKMKVEEELIDRVHLLSKTPHLLSELYQLSASSKNLNTFKWDNCGKTPSLLTIKNLTIGPDPLHFPGNANLQFTATIKEDLDAPLQVNLTVKKEITPTFWIEIPCIGGIGSCSYDDLCEVLSGAICPKPFVKYQIPCKCPFNKGSYKMQKSDFYIDVNAGIPSGNYYIKASISYKQQLVSCLDVYFSMGPN